MAVNLRTLIKKLNDTGNGLEGAAGLCVSRAHYHIEVEHLLMKLLDATYSELEPAAAGQHA
jgi:type VI secretion system protein VasG